MTSTNAPYAPAAQADPAPQEPPTALPRCATVPDDQLARCEVMQLVALRRENSAALELLLHKQQVMDLTIDRYRQHALQKVEAEEKEAAAIAQRAAATREWLKNNL